MESTEQKTAPKETIEQFRLGAVQLQSMITVLAAYIDEWLPQSTHKDNVYYTLRAMEVIAKRLENL